MLALAEQPLKLIWAKEQAIQHSKFIISEEMEQAWNTLEHTHENLLLLGRAGTGKSTFLGWFRKHTRKKVAIVAPTGVAAFNAQGQTIHSLFKFPPRFIQQENIEKDKRAIFKKMELLFIDEISMVRADVLDGIDTFLKKARGNNEPFGGVQMCIMGDIFQLPPIVSRDEKDFFAQYYGSPFFFKTKSYKNAHFRTVEFQKIHRQSEEEFISFLEKIRFGNCTHSDLTTINNQVNEHKRPQELVLTTTNARAHSINHQALQDLKGQHAIYNGSWEGAKDFKIKQLPAPEQLILKEGAQVMFLKNDPIGRWVNGTMGIVKNMAPHHVWIETEEGLVKVEAEKWQTIQYEWDEAKNKVVEKVIGSYEQIPLTLAWAMTIHKSQGKTLQHVFIDLDKGAFAPGQVYVALSRCRTLADVRLKSPLKITDIICNQEIIDFMQAELGMNKRLE